MRIKYSEKLKIFLALMLLPALVFFVFLLVGKNLLQYEKSNLLKNSLRQTSRVLGQMVVAELGKIELLKEKGLSDELIVLSSSTIQYSEKETTVVTHFNSQQSGHELVDTREILKSIGKAPYLIGDNIISVIDAQIGLFSSVKILKESIEIMTFKSEHLKSAFVGNNEFSTFLADSAGQILLGENPTYNKNISSFSHWNAFIALQTAFNKSGMVEEDKQGETPLAIGFFYIPHTNLIALVIQENRHLKLESVIHNNFLLILLSYLCLTFVVATFYTRNWSTLLRRLKTLVADVEADHYEFEKGRERTKNDDFKQVYMAFHKVASFYANKFSELKYAHEKASECKSDESVNIRDNRFHAINAALQIAAAIKQMRTINHSIIAESPPHLDPTAGSYREPVFLLLRTTARIYGTSHRHGLQTIKSICKNTQKKIQDFKIIDLVARKKIITIINDALLEMQESLEVFVQTNSVAYGFSSLNSMHYRRDYADSLVHDFYRQLLLDKKNHSAEGLEHLATLFYKDFVSLSVVDLLASEQNHAYAFAQRNAKEILPLEITGADLSLDSQVCYKLINIISLAILHIIHQSIEHPAERIEVGKKAKGKILIDLKRIIKAEKSYFLLSIEDDGRGIDGAPDLTNFQELLAAESLLEKMFLPALQDMARELSGKVSTKSFAGEGSIIMVMLPAEYP